MLNKFLIITILCFASFVSHAQIDGEANYLIKYEVDFLLDKSNPQKVEHEVHRLYTGNTIGYYAHEGVVLRDSLRSIFKNNSSTERNMTKAFNSIPNSKFDAIVYKNFDNDLLLVQYNLGWDTYVYEEPNATLQWEIKSETKEAGRYTMQKAIATYGGRDWVAWFAIEIPIPDGPYVFSGLPGLILELYDTEKHYQFNVASITPLTEEYPIAFDKNKKQFLSKDKFVKYYKEYKKNPIGSMTRGRNMVMIDENGKKIEVDMKEVERNAKEKAARENNFIEIW